ncbi:MAG TPA: CBS domain-containing protein [Candidatus Brocadiia bacterium]|nr:CBS domain-containing protein [Candidatus Brocadiales bacterium]
MLVKDIMKTDVITLDTDAKLGFAEEIMYLGRIRHLPVVKNGFLVGIISQRDLFKASLTSIITTWKENKKFLDSIEIKEVMVSDVVTVLPDCSVEEAAQLLVDKKIGCLPVVEDNMKLKGLITETDFLQYYISQAKKNK